MIAISVGLTNRARLGIEAPHVPGPTRGDGPAGNSDRSRAYHETRVRGPAVTPGQTGVWPVRVVEITGSGAGRWLILEK